MIALVPKVRRRIEKSILQYGVVATIGRCLVWPVMYLSWKLTEMSPSGRRHRQAGEEYDAQYRVDTCRDRSAEWAADIESENWAGGVGYEPTPPDTLRKSIGSLPIDHQEFVFIDIGCGKGRVVLAAAEFPFKRVIGVEYAPDLAEIAEKNRETYSNPARRCEDMEFHCHDAATFPLPTTPLVLYFAHPFDETVTHKFLAHVLESLESHPRKIYLVYYDPICASVFEDFGFREYASQDLEGYSGVPALISTYARWFDTLGFRNRVGKEYIVYEHAEL